MTELETELAAALEKCERLIGQMTPFVGRMALPDYTLLNDAPLAARKALTKVAERMG